MFSRVLSLTTALAVAVTFSTSYLGLLPSLLFCACGAMLVYRIRRRQEDVALASLVFAFIAFALRDGGSHGWLFLQAVLLSLAIAGSGAVLAVLVWGVRQFVLRRESHQWTDHPGRLLE